MKTFLLTAYFRRVDCGGCSVDFPDLPGCVSAGDSIPSASDPATLSAETGAFIAPVEGLPDMVRDEIRNRSVKKTLTIPYWLNEEAEARHVNFPQVLQEALKERMGV